MEKLIKIVQSSSSRSSQYTPAERRGVVAGKAAGAKDPSRTSLESENNPLEDAI